MDQDYRLKIEYYPIEKLKPYERNARKHGNTDIDAIAASIKAFGFKDPIGIWGDDIIVEGHGRLLAAKKLKMKQIPVIRLDDLTDEERRGYALAHNKTAEISVWDEDALSQEISDLSDTFDMSSFGFEIENETQVHEDEYTPEVPAEPVAMRGQIWQLGRHRLMCGDSTNADEVATLMGGRQADMLLTDPPYNVDISGQAGKIMNDNMDDGAFREFLTDAFKAGASVMRKGAAFHIWHASSEAYNFLGAVRDCGMLLRQVLIWVKNAPTLGRQDFQWMHEPCLAGEAAPEETETVEEAAYGWKDGTHSWYKKRKEKTVLFFEKPKSSKEHPTMKPVLLFDYEMQCNTQKGDAVLDLFGGSGTTIIAAEQNGRDAYVMELDPAYCDVIINRWESFTGSKAQLI